MTLGEITQSEFTLLGAMSEDELMMALEGATPQAKRTFVKTVKSMASKTRLVAPSRGSVVSLKSASTCCRLYPGRIS